MYFCLSVVSDKKACFVFFLNRLKYGKKWFYMCLMFFIVCVISQIYCIKNEQTRQIMDKILVVTAKLISRCICFTVRLVGNSNTTAATSCFIG